MSSSPSLSGPTDIPADATHLLVCLHGFGDEGQSYLNFAPVLNAILSQTPSPANGKMILGLAAPNAPQLCTGGGYQWFWERGWKFNDEKGMAQAATLLEGYLAELSQTHNIPRSRIALLGFSQGVMTALYALPNLSQPPACVLAYCGGLTVAPTVPQAAPRVPILFLHGLADDIWPTDYTINGETFFRTHGYPTELVLQEDLGHGIDATALAHGAAFLATHLITTND